MKPDKKRHKDQKFIIENAKKARRRAEKLRKPEEPKVDTPKPPAEEPRLGACSTRDIAASQSRSPTAEVAKYVGYLEMVAELQAACDRSVAETEEASKPKPSLLRRILGFLFGSAEKTQTPG